MLLFLSGTCFQAACLLAQVSAASKSCTVAPKGALFMTGGAAEAELKDYSGEVSSLFNNIRVPAALFAGASAGAAFAMPIAAGEGLRIGMIKRIYAMFMISALSSQIIAIIVSTLALMTLTMGKSPLTSSVNELMQSKFEFDWITAQFNLLSGMLLFVIGSGLRAWISIGCPVVAKACLGIIVSGTLVCLGQIDAITREVQGKGLWNLPVTFGRLTLSRFQSSPLFFVAGAASVATVLYIGKSIPHLYKALAAGV